MQLEILTPQKKVFSGEANLVKVPGSNGSFEILKNHAPIISTLTDGELKVETGSGSFRYLTSGGVVEVKKNHVVILLETIAEAEKSK